MSFIKIKQVMALIIAISCCTNTTQPSTTKKIATASMVTLGFIGGYLVTKLFIKELSANATINCNPVSGKQECRMYDEKVTTQNLNDPINVIAPFLCGLAAASLCGLITDRAW